MAVPDVQEMLRLLEEGRSREAVERLEDVARGEPYSPTVRILLAHAYEREGEFARALRTWHAARLLMPTSPVAGAAIVRLRSDHPELDSAPRHRPEQEIAGMAVRESADWGTSEPPGVVADDGHTAHASAATGAAAAPIENLDRLIHELESARIVPDPDFEPEAFVEDPDEGDDLVSETLARIYAAQQQYTEAAQVYETLAVQHPERAGEFRARARELRDLG